PKPRAPALNGLFVMQRKRMPIRVHRQVQNVERHEEKRHENEWLDPFFVAGPFRDVPKLFGPAQPEDQKKEKPAKKIRKEEKSVARPRVSHRLGLNVIRNG